MRNCTVYLRNSQLDPASYYRIYQYADEMDYNLVFRDAFTNREFIRNQSIKNKWLKRLYQLWLLPKICIRVYRNLGRDLREGTDCVFIQRETVPRICAGPVYGRLKRLCRQAGVIWDFDDNIIENGEITRKEMLLLAEESSKIIVTHEFLRETLLEAVGREEVKDKILLLPTTDLEIQKRFKDRSYEDLLNAYKTRVRLIWVGSSSNLKELEGILPSLEQAADELSGKQLELVVVCNQRPDAGLVASCKRVKIEFVKWSREKATEELSKAHIGIMPLTDNAFSRGKGAFKAIQYLGAGIPVIASAVGFNRQVINSEVGEPVESADEWERAVINLSGDEKKWLAMAKAARAEFEMKYNPEVNYDCINKIMKEITRQ